MQQHVVRIECLVAGKHDGKNWDTIVVLKTVLPFIPERDIYLLVPIVDEQFKSQLVVNEVSWDMKDQCYEAFINHEDYPFDRDIDNFLVSCEKLGWIEDPTSREWRLEELEYEETE